MADRLDSYKLVKEAFHADNPGDTVFNINKICLTALSSYQLWRTAIPLLPLRFQRGWRLVAVEYVVLVLPLLLVLTTFSGHSIRFNLFIYAIIALLYTQSRQAPARSSTTTVSANGQPSHHKRTASSASMEGEAVDRYIGRTIPSSFFQKPLVTVWRAHMMLMTVICILAVDFPVFPRIFGKCENWGTSIMDLGVGSFVFSLGLTSSQPFLRNLRTSETASFAQAFRRSAAVLALGIIRILSVKGTDYPEHVTEYGVHWNFFFTLGLLPLCGVFAERLWKHLSFQYMAHLVTALHQLSLIVTPLQAFVLGSNRTNLLAMNKEGLASFPGYLAIYLLGMDTGVYVLPPDPYFAYRNPEKKALLEPKLGKLMNVLFSYAAVWWTVFGALHFYAPASMAVSRRVANTGYVYWVTAFNVAFLLCYLAVDRSSGVRASSSDQPSAPAIFQAINKNGLLIFLLANLLTGAVNLSMQTMYSSDATAVSVLVLYMGLIVSVAWFLRNKRLKL